MYQNIPKVDYLSKWDWLIILDACRYDYFTKLWKIGRIEPRISLESCSIGVLELMPEIPDSILITGHPFPLKRKDKFTEIIDVGFDYNLSTSPPNYITRWLRENYLYACKFKRRILWFLQPHHPYIGDVKLDVRIYEDPKTKRLTPQAKTEYLLKKAKEDGILEKAYESNLKLVLRTVKWLITVLKGKIVITSDHGEGLGEPLRPGDKPIYSHPCNRDELEVRLIPWCEIGG